jgi:Cu-processing system permease protein
MTPRADMEGHGRWRRLRVLAGEEFRCALESRWLFGFTTLLTALVLGLSFFGLAQGREVGFQSLARVTLSLMNLVLFIVPLAGLVLGVTSIAGGSGTLPLLLAQPVGRGEVLSGKLIGLGAALTVAQLVGFGGGGLIVALQAGGGEVNGFLALTGLSIALGWLSISTSLCIAVIWPDRLKAMWAALLMWLLMVVAYDLVVLGAAAILRGLPLQSVLLPALMINPVDLARVLTTMAVGSGALFGPTSAVLMRSLGTQWGITLGLAVLLVECVTPMVIAMRVFRRRDW